jgi:hypothetical protein
MENGEHRLESVQARPAPEKSLKKNRRALAGTVSKAGATRKLAVEAASLRCYDRFAFP